MCLKNLSGASDRAFVCRTVLVQMQNPRRCQRDRACDRAMPGSRLRQSGLCRRRVLRRLPERFVLLDLVDCQIKLRETHIFVRVFRLHNIQMPRSPELHHRRNQHPVSPRQIGFHKLHEHLFQKSPHNTDIREQKGERRLLTAWPALRRRGLGLPDGGTTGTGINPSNTAPPKKGHRKLMFHKKSRLCLSPRRFKSFAATPVPFVSNVSTDHGLLVTGGVSYPLEPRSRTHNARNGTRSSLASDH